MAHFAFVYYFFQSSNGMNFPSMCVGQSIFPAFLEALFRHYRKLGLLYQFSLDIIETWVYFINFYYLNTFLHWSLVVKTMITFNIPQYRMFILSPASFNILFKIFKSLIIFLALFIYLAWKDLSVSWNCGLSLSFWKILENLGKNQSFFFFFFKEEYIKHGQEKLRKIPQKSQILAPERHY